MRACDRILAALDVDTLETAEQAVKDLAPHLTGVKAGLELLTAAGPRLVVERLCSSGARVFYDGKFNDIPATVAAVSRVVTSMGVWMFNLHALGGPEMMLAAKNGVDEVMGSSNPPAQRPLIVAVTILTSLDYDELVKVGFAPALNVADQEKPQIEQEHTQNQVIRLALLAKECGLDGVVASAKEVAAIRQSCGPEFKIVTPGIRPAGTAADDQKRIGTPAQAIKDGADYLVIGRPLVKPSGMTRAEAAQAIIKEMEAAL